MRVFPSPFENVTVVVDSERRYKCECDTESLCCFLYSAVILNVQYVEIGAPILYFYTRITCRAEYREYNLKQHRTTFISFANMQLVGKYFK